VASSDDNERGARRTGPAVESMYRFVLWLVPTVEKFPRRQKFLLGSAAGDGTSLGYELLPCGNRLRGLCDRRRAGTARKGEAEQRVRAWVAHAARDTAVARGIAGALR